jgi:hypothetical protein
MNRKWTCYGLVDPRTGKVRYVGSTVNPCSREYAVTQGPLRSKRMAEWVEDLSRVKLHPQWVNLETSKVGDRKEAEQRWIGHFSCLGNNLVNILPGGEGYGKSACRKQTRQTGVLTMNETPRLKNRLTCKRCDWCWDSLVNDPRVCPRCKSYSWRIRRIRGNEVTK